MSANTVTTPLLGGAWFVLGYFYMGWALAAPVGPIGLSLTTFVRIGGQP